MVDQRYLPTRSSAVSGTEIAYGAGARVGVGRADQEHRQGLTPPNHMQIAAFSVQFVPGLRLLLFDFAVDVLCPVLTSPMFAQPCVWYWHNKWYLSY
eukprot:3594610-Rhodomonas_salina.1